MFITVFCILYIMKEYSIMNLISCACDYVSHHQGWAQSIWMRWSALGLRSLLQTASLTEMNWAAAMRKMQLWGVTFLPWAFIIEWVGHQTIEAFCQWLHFYILTNQSVEYNCECTKMVYCGPETNKGWMSLMLSECMSFWYLSLYYLTTFIIAHSKTLQWNVPSSFFSGVQFVLYLFQTAAS